jgi:UDP-4-amino-4,6-dideoxy-N-acetyl-beta-L-altrosamine transaminase
MKDFIPYVKHHIDSDDIEAVVNAMESSFITQGPKVVEFENAIAKYSGAKYGSAVSNGTAALHIACLAAGLKKGEVLITSPITFVASSNCGLYVGAEVAFTDVDKYGCMSAPSLEKTIDKLKKQGKKPTVVIPVHLAGNVCDMKAINEISRQHNLTIIEDASHALGTKTNEGPIGNCKYSDMAVFSTHPAKNITTGEGGIVVTNSEKLHSRLNLFRSHGITKDQSVFEINDQGPWHYEQQELGYNYRISDIQCALGISQLKKLDSFIAKKRSLVKKYNSLIEDLPVHHLDEREGVKSAYHLYLLNILSLKTIEDKKEFYKHMHSEGIGINMHYIPVYRQPYYLKTGLYNPSDFPSAEKYFIECASFPLFVDLEESKVERVIDTLKKVLEKF